MIRETGTVLDGWAQAGQDRPRRPLGDVIAGGSELWVVAESPPGVLDVRFALDGERFTGLIREGSEELPVSRRRLTPER